MLSTKTEGAATRICFFSQRTKKMKLPILKTFYIYIYLQANSKSTDALKKIKLSEVK